MVKNMCCQLKMNDRRTVNGIKKRNSISFSVGFFLIRYSNEPPIDYSDCCLLFTNSNTT